MKNIFRTIGLVAAFALVGATSTRASSYDCYYECWNSTTLQEMQVKTQTFTYGACCSPTASFSCPSGFTYEYSVFWVSPKSGPQLCTD